MIRKFQENRRSRVIAILSVKSKPIIETNGFFIVFNLLIIFGSDRFRRLKESPVADLHYLSFYMAAHLTGQIQAGIRLIHGVALRTGEVNKMAAVLQHLSSTWLFSPPC